MEKNATALIKNIGVTLLIIYVSFVMQSWIFVIRAASLPGAPEFAREPNMVAKGLLDSLTRPDLGIRFAWPHGEYMFPIAFFITLACTLTPRRTYFWLIPSLFVVLYATMLLIWVNSMAVSKQFELGFRLLSLFPIIGCGYWGNRIVFPKSNVMELKNDY